MVSGGEGMIGGQAGLEGVGVEDGRWGRYGLRVGWYGR
jgi:hypothetical protein